MSLTLNATDTALVLIDLQQGIVARDLAPHTPTDVVTRCAELADSMRDVGGTVVYVHVLLHELVPADADQAPPPPTTPPSHQASDLVPEAGYRAGRDMLVTKRQWDAFYATNLDQALRRKGIHTIILAGIATNFGVESTARSAQARGYNIVFAHDAMSGSKTEMHEFAVTKLFPIIGKVRSTKEVIEALH